MFKIKKCSRKSRDKESFEFEDISQYQDIVRKKKNIHHKPAITSSNKAQSVTVFAIGPRWSIAGMIGHAPMDIKTIYHKLCLQ